MIFCSCAGLACSADAERCDIQKFMEKHNGGRAAEGLPPISVKDIGKTVKEFYAANHHARGIKPCEKCAPTVKAEISDLVAGKPCTGLAPQRKPRRHLSL